MKQKAPPQKYRLGTISNTKLPAGLNRFYMAITSPSASAVVHKYLIVNLVVFPLWFWRGNFFLIAPFPDHCLLVPFFFYCSSKFEIQDHKQNQFLHYMCFVHARYFFVMYPKYFHEMCLFSRNLGHPQTLGHEMTATNAQASIYPSYQTR